MKRIKMLLVLLLLSSCTSLTIKSLDILSNDIVQDKDQFLKNILYSYNLIETIDKKYGYTLVPYKYKDTLFFNYKKKDSKNVLVYVHGGAFYIRTVNSFYYTMNEKILENCPKDYEIILLDYKGLKYPEQNKELENVLDYVQKRYDRIVLMGDSSGGNLILSQVLKRRDEHKKLPDGLVLLSPWTDLTNTVKSRKDNFTKDVLFGKTYPKLLLNNPYIEDVKDKANPYISPVYGDYHNFPKTLIQCGSTELLLDDSRIVYENMKGNKVDAKLEIYDNMVHVFQLFGIFDRTDEALKNVSKFLGGIYKW